LVAERVDEEAAELCEMLRNHVVIVHVEPHIGAASH
jgi:hypothetical protein